MKTLTAMKFNQTIILFVLLMSGPSLFAGKGLNKITKVFEKSFATTKLSELHVKNERGNIQIINTQSSEGKVEVSISATGKDEEEINKLFEQFELTVRETGNIIDIVSEDNIDCWTIMNTFFRNSNKIKFEDKSVAEGITEIDIEMVLYLPEVKKLQAKNKYHDILFSTLPCSLDADLYSGKLKGDNISGDLTLSMKYGEVIIANFVNGNIDIYDSNFDSGNCSDVRFKSKYSDISLGNLNSFDLDSYDDEVFLGNIVKDFDFNAKYSNLKMGSFENADMDVYDSDIRAENGKNITLRSKYGSFDFNTLESAALRLYDDDFEAESIIDLKIKESKYSDLSFDKFLGGSLSINSSYEDDIRFSDSIEDFESLNLDSKYTTLRFPLASNVKYQLEAKTKYGNLDISDKFEQTYKDKDDSTMELKGMANGAGSGNPKIIINAYDSKIDLSF